MRINQDVLAFFFVHVKRSKEAALLLFLNVPIKEKSPVSSSYGVQI